MNRDEVRAILVRHRGGRGLQPFYEEVCRIAKMPMSKSHLANILAGRKPPNEAVMRYLGGTMEKKVERTVTYTIRRNGTRAKGKRRTKHV